MEKMTESRKEVLDFLRIDEYPHNAGFGCGYGSGSGYSYDSVYVYDFNYGSDSGYGFICGSGFGYGSGSGSGSGYESGCGNGFGCGNDFGSAKSCFGNGFGSGTVVGSGNGNGSNIDKRNIKIFNDMVVHEIDNMPTMIDSVHGNFAKGRILSDDLTTKPCFIAKMGNYFAHGESLKQAFIDVTEKFTKHQPIQYRIAKFNDVYKDRNAKIPVSELFSWHHILTGSCLMGRIQFCKDHNLDYKNGEYTVNEFIQITKDAYGGDVIRQLESSL